MSIDVDVDISTSWLEDVDWDAVLPCEHSQHVGEDVAAWHISTFCPLCSVKFSYLMCTRCKNVTDKAHRLTDQIGCGKVASRWMWNLNFRRIE